ncbi:hypothetical protein GGH93_004320 [Coemansia aciculifera]|nr:hypothetical protein GGH93_004320 [Coemansia aciculifera]
MLYRDFMAELAARGITANTLKFSVHESSDIVVPILLDDYIEMCVVPQETKYGKIHLTPQYKNVINNLILDLITSENADNKPVLAESFFTANEWLYHPFPHLRVFVDAEMVKFIETQRRIRRANQSIEAGNDKDNTLQTEEFVVETKMAKQRPRRNKWRFWHAINIFKCIGF